MTTLNSVPTTQETTLNGKVSKSLYHINGLYFSWNLLVNWLIIVVSFIAIAKVGSPWIVVLLCFLVGTRMHALAILGHEATHFNAFRNRKIGDFICQILIAWPLGIDMTAGYRPWHFQHHKALGTENDVELSYRNRWPYLGNNNWIKIAFYFATDLCGFGIRDMSRFYFAVLPKDPRWLALRPLIFWVSMALLLLTLDGSWIIGCWFFCLVTGFWAIFRVRTFTEHIEVEANGKHSSHRFSAGLVARLIFFPHNTFLHYEHHLFPRVPFYNLPLARRNTVTMPVKKFSELFPVFPPKKVTSPARIQFCNLNLNDESTP